MMVRILLPAAALLMAITAVPPSASSANGSPIVLAQASSGPWVPYCQRFRNSAQRDRCTQEVLSGIYGGGYYGPRYGGYSEYYGPRYHGYVGYYEPRDGEYSDYF
jgi:hypothetical protein